MPKIDIAKLPVDERTGYPPPYDRVVAGRSRKRLGNAAGLDQFGVNLTTLAPGAASAQRHWHEREDEFVYVLEGEVVLRTDAGEQLLTAGMCAGFPAGNADGHQFINRSAAPAVFLEVSNRESADTAYYPELDMMYVGGKPMRRDGTPL